MNTAVEIAARLDEWWAKNESRVLKMQEYQREVFGNVFHTVYAETAHVTVPCIKYGRRKRKYRLKNSLRRIKLPVEVDFKIRWKPLK